jgi:hypothetical protein
MMRAFAVFLCLFLLFGTGLSVDAINLRNIFSRKNAERAGKTVVVAAVIRQFAEELNGLINGLFLNNNAANKEMTKVVPIFSAGERLAVGGAQVSGSAEQLAEVSAVFQIDGDFHRGKFRVKGFVPSTSSTELDRVYGVGVTALIDYHVR